MKNYTINEINDTMAIHCETQEEFIRIAEMIPNCLSSHSDWLNYEDKTVIFPNPVKDDLFKDEFGGSYGCIEGYAKNNDYQIIPSTSVKSTEDSAVIETQANEALISKEETTGEDIADSGVELRPDLVQEEPEIEMYQELFNHMSHEHGLTLVQSEMQEIIRLCEPYYASQSEISQLRESNRELVDLLREYYIADCVPDTEDFLKNLNVRYESLFSKHNNK